MSEEYSSLLGAFEGMRVAVVGDYLLDRYIVGHSARVSREAPIVVIEHEREVNHPGGAANAAQNISALGAVAVAVGVLGDDSEGSALSALLSERGVDASGLVVDEHAHTSTKLRILAGEMNAQKQQVARVDRSHRVVLDGSLRERLSAVAEAAVASCDAVLVSDYGMGVTSDGIASAVLAGANARGIPVVIDSRFNLADFAGATVATPNEVESLDALGIRSGARIEDAELASRLIKHSGIESFVVTQGSQGMLVCHPDGTCSRVGIVGSNEATDVTGAGDTVSAVVALSLASAATLLDAARMATYAAAVVVMKRGTATASVDEIRQLVKRFPVADRS